MDWQNIILYILVFVDFWFGFTVLMKSKKSTANQSYAFFVLWIVLWTLGIAMFRASSNLNLLLFWNRLYIIAAIMIAASLLHFSLVFPYKRYKIRIYHLIAIYSPVIIVIFATMMPGVLIKNIFIRDWGNESILGWGYIYYGIYFSILSILALYELWRKFQDSRGTLRSQLFYVIIGLLISLAFGAVFDLLLILLGNYKWIWLGPYASFIMLATIGYAIVAHHMMDVKLVMRKYLVNAFSLLSLVLPFSFIKFLIIRYLAEYSLFFDIIILSISLLIFPYIQQRFYKIANKYFFSSLYNERELIGKISDRLRSTLQAYQIYENISQSLLSAFHAKRIVFYLYSEKHSTFEVCHQRGLARPYSHAFKTNAFINKYLLSLNRASVVDDFRSQNKVLVDPLVKSLKKVNMEAVVPMNIKDKIIGLIALGEKETKEPYSSVDLRTLTIVGNQAAIGINNAISYEEIKNFSKKLEREITAATHDLRVANTKLKKLDQAKSEFVSIASHQLRTPLTVIKGYISMIMEGNFGKIDDNLQDALDKVFASNERLIRLVENLLNISRIESGRLHFTFSEYQFEKIVQSVYDELKTSAEGKGLKFIYKQPPKLSPRTLLDEEKIRQVVMNLSDNAIKYTDSGHVIVSLDHSPNSIIFCVEDSGLGISKQDIGKLFKKFSRGTDVSLVHTEGTGLGLYVAREIIEAHHGRIWAESDGVGKGSRFCFELPILKDLPPEYKTDTI